MKLLFATDRLHVPDDFSGSVQTTHSVILGLTQRGHQCEILASLPGAWRHFAATALYRLSARRRIREFSNRDGGYPVHRGSQWRFAERVAAHSRRYAPEVLVLDSIRQLRALEAGGFDLTCPVIVVLHDTYFAEGSSDLPFGRTVRLVANSPHTALVASRHFGVDAAIVPPLVRLDQYRTERPNPRFVTLVTPNPKKGLDLVLALAEKLPRWPFLMVEGWPMDRRQWTALRRRVRSLGNVTLSRSTAEMRQIYRLTRVLLAPSQIPETFGRVVVEAQASGIPVMATDIGALAWVVGDGGVVLELESDISEWVHQLSELLLGGARYGELSRKAIENAQRPDFQPDRVLTRFEQVLLETKSP